MSFLNPDETADEMFARWKANRERMLTVETDPVSRANLTANGQADDLLDKLAVSFRQEFSTPADESSGKDAILPFILLAGLMSLPAWLQYIV